MLWNLYILQRWVYAFVRFYRVNLRIFIFNGHLLEHPVIFP